MHFEVRPAINLSANLVEVGGTVNDNVLRPVLAKGMPPAEEGKCRGRELEEVGEMIDPRPCLAYPRAVVIGPHGGRQRGAELYHVPVARSYTATTTTTASTTIATTTTTVTVTTSAAITSAAWIRHESTASVADGPHRLESAALGVEAAGQPIAVAARGRLDSVELCVGVQYEGLEGVGMRR